MRPLAVSRSFFTMATSRILVVDQEPYTRAVIATMLEKSNYLPVLATDGHEAMAHIEQDAPFDVVLSDIMIHGVDGIGLLDKLREIHPDTPMVMVTAMQDVSIAISAMRRGAYDYLLKPFAREQLLATIERALDYRRLVQQNSMYRQNLEELVSARTEMLRQAIHDLERSYDITLEALGDALDLKDAETEGHSKRVTAYTIALARHMGVPEPQMRIVARGAFLHDIGKMAIPDAILLKPGRLDSGETSIMREHCLRGYQILRKIPFLSDAAEIVYSHQEHFDGSGYPRGLKDKQIIEEARIVAVADTVEAMVSHRPYRSSQGLEAALTQIRADAGTKLDAAVVAACCRLFESGRFSV